MIKKLFNKKIYFLLTTGFIAIFVGIIGGVVDIIQPQNVIDTALHLGYPLYFFTLLGVFKILGAIGLFLPKAYNKLKDVVYAGFTIDFIFASFSHFSVNDEFVKIIVPLVMLGILSISYKLKE
ncbi:DoxX family protein [Poseidonibacter lekithochrous]|uniref:DoxX family protein n=1 Tax=Poseidonibacter TaxID=2321187 RepID=UPI001C092E88|nr:MULTISPECIES: DoxX family protein [Poseidonibacter]MBU3013256.1 DoxX family protein [Poseidonibacter lekithochrous]MDO6826553.1 DoxX family protein [Poseidonibacter sp. 1_MG-2023]